MKTALTIAGSDSSGGAGIQADIKTMTMNGVFAMSAITALTAQNTTGVTGILNSTPEFLAQQLDPVMVATSGAALLEPDAVTALETELLPLAEVITPNIPEAEILCGHSIKTAADMENAAKEISQKFGCNVLCKGGHNLNDANDLLVLTDGSAAWFNGQRIDNPNTHGTGCTLSSAIASNLAKGYDLETAVRRAKAYISGALAAMLDLGHGSGPMNHAFALDNEWSKEAEA